MTTELGNSLVDLTKSDIAELQSLVQKKTFAENEIVISEGQPAFGIAFISSGLVRVEREWNGHGILITQLGEGEVLGEIAFVENSMASASVIADMPSELLWLEKGGLQRLLENNPELAGRFYRSLARNLAQRVRETTRHAMGQPFSWG